MKNPTALGGLLRAAVAFATLAATSPLHECAREQTWAVGQTVATTSGKVIGHAAPVANEVSEYLGIPFAQPPIGSLRFEPPVPFNGSHHINATEFGFACVQTGSSDDPQSEDCLTLNIWTKPQVGEKKKAVLVWIYGGAYVLGSSRLPIYNGQFFADQEDVILVSFNYRLNIFGFPGNPATPANLGLLDMRQALLWVRNNIAKFGGDVDRITIFGQSAGAGMVDFYSYAYAEDPIANGFILQSATVDGFPALVPGATVSRWSRIAEAAGCGPTSENPTECMRSKTPEEILGAFSEDDTAIGANPQFGPVADDILVYADYNSRRSARGGYLIGNNQNEAGIFRLIQPNRTEAYWRDFNDRLYTCADAERLARSTAEGNPSWRYRYFGDFPNLAVSTDPPSGAYHGAEIQPLFDTVPQEPVPSTLEQVAVGDYLRGAWAAFAKDPKQGLVAYAEGWPKYKPMQETLVRLAFDNQVGANLALGNAYDGPCDSL
ncbi:carboxylesterase [Ilyonectria robusta]|uniref:carboxylesterase n=1 Tax=Ilyonectria robusta TaxID=1079257 RepID=UPI001E8CE628|nr:carboxylesterase [Ilyonectria robusta]KAH8649770.1 carboxylesterase [Ilyonectria robusta]